MQVRAKTGPDLLECYIGWAVGHPRRRKGLVNTEMEAGVLWQSANMEPKAAGLNAQRRMGEEHDENPIVHSAPCRLKYRAGHNPD